MKLGSGGVLRSALPKPARGTEGIQGSRGSRKTLGSKQTKSSRSSTHPRTRTWILKNCAWEKKYTFLSFPFNFGNYGIVWCTYLALGVLASAEKDITIFVWRLDDFVPSNHFTSFDHVTYCVELGYVQPGYAFGPSSLRSDLLAGCHWVLVQIRSWKLTSEWGSEEIGSHHLWRNQLRTVNM